MNNLVLSTRHIDDFISDVANEVVRKLQGLNIESQQPPQPTNRKFDIHQAADYLNLTVPTLYSKNSKGELPSCKVGKRLYFFESDLVAYLQSGRNKTNKEIEKEASEYLTVKNRRS